MFVFIKEYLVKLFLLLVSCITAAIGLFCLILNPSAIFTINIFGQILLLSAICTFPSLLYFSKKEISKKQMLIKNIVVFFVTMICLFTFAIAAEWITFDILPTVFLLAALYIVIYCIAYVQNYFYQKKIAGKINAALQAYLKSKSDLELDR